MKPDLRLRAVLLCWLAGCTTAGSERDPGFDGSADGIADNAQAELADASVDGVWDAMRDAPGEAWEKPDVQELAATRELRFHVKNEAAIPLFMAITGIMCRSWQVEQQDGSGWKRLALSLHNESEFCACKASCDRPGNRNTAFKEIGPDNETVVLWDGRSYLTWVEEQPCAEGEARMWTTVQGVKQPVAPGRYRVTIGLETALQEFCKYWDASEDWQCSLVDPWAEPPGIEELCPAGLHASAEFDIPDTGDVDVALSFPSPGPCEPAGIWQVSSCAWSTLGPIWDELALVQDGDGGVTGTMGVHLPPDVGSPEGSSSVTMDDSKCQLTAVSSSTWTSGGAPQCDVRELSAELHGDTGFGVMKRTLCNGHAPDSGKAIFDACTATLTRK
jgi:hypothetical protein